MGGGYGGVRTGGGGGVEGMEVLGRGVEGMEVLGHGVEVGWRVWRC